MSTFSPVNGNPAILFGKTRFAVLSLLYGHPEKAFYLRQIIRSCGCGQGAVQREVALLHSAGLLSKEYRGNQVYYQAKPDGPTFHYLQAVLKKDDAGQVPSRKPRKVPAEINIDLPKKAISALCRKHHIKKLSLFGSVLRDDFRPDSDIDVLVEFLPGLTPGFAFFGIEEELAAVFGRKVDLATPGSLSPSIRDNVIREAVLQYAA